MSFGDASAFSRFNPTPKAPRAPIIRGPYAFDRSAGTVDLNLLGDWDEGHTEADVLFGMMQGDAALPQGQHAEISVWEPFVEEGLDEGQTRNNLQKYIVKGFDALCTLPYPMTLSDVEGVFATIDMTGISFEEIRNSAHQAVADRLGGTGTWRREGGFIGKTGTITSMHVPIVRA